MMSVENTALLQSIGERVRALRARRGMTRKMLAEDSGISERYLAQLEQGQGNISISLLNQAAHALQVELTELTGPESQLSPEQQLINNIIRELDSEDQKAVLQLLHDKFSPGLEKNQRFALVGLRGAGKTTLGKMLAEHFQLPFISLVEEIQRAAGMGVSEIFSLSGQAGYRRLEEQVLMEAVQAHKRCVIETGGSIVAAAKLLNVLLSTSRVIWLRASAEEHMSRVIEQGDLRPMADNDNAMADLKRILQEREPYYAKAHVTLDTSAKDIESCFRELLDALQ